MGGEAAEVVLSAVGHQDTYLLSCDPEQSLFKYDNSRQHSNFRKFHRVTNVLKPPQAPPDWPFGQTIKVRMSPQNMGDLLANMYLSVTMPALNAGENYADQLGRHLVRVARMRVDELVVEEIHDDWGVIYDELYLEMSEKVANRFLVNRSIAFDASELNETYARYKSDLIVPMHFFFSRKYAADEYETNQPNRPYFPACACHKQNIEFEFEFHHQNFFSNTATTLGLQSFDLITEEITLEPEERLYFMREPYRLVTDLVVKHPSLQDVTLGSNIKLGLVPKIPVKCIHWFFRDNRFENIRTIKEDGETDEGNFYIHNRFNFSSNVNFDELYTFFSPVMLDAKFFIQGNALPDITSTDHVFYKYLQPFQKRLSRPIRNIYTYSFSMNPVNVDPSGSLAFDQLQSDKTVLDCKLQPGISNTYSLHMYYTGYQTFDFDKGFMSLAA